MKIKQSRIKKGLPALICNVLGRHVGWSCSKVPTVAVSDMVNSCGIGSVCFTFGSNDDVWATEVTVSVRVKAGESGYTPVDKALGSLDVRVDVGCGGSTHSVSSAVVLASNWQRAIALAAEMEAALSGIEIVKD